MRCREGVGLSEAPFWQREKLLAVGVVVFRGMEPGSERIHSRGRARFRAKSVGGTKDQRAAAGERGCALVGGGWMLGSGVGLSEAPFWQREKLLAVGVVVFRGVKLVRRSFYSRRPRARLLRGHGRGGTPATPLRAAQLDGTVRP
jgi:hypothetical protein